MNIVHIAVQDWSGMSDCIDRQTLINLLTSRAETLRGLYGDLGGAASGVRKLVQAMPSAEPEWKWIPVTERLPEDSETVLITHKGGVSFGWYNGIYWERGASTKHRPLQTVIAWMPLPEPWEGDQ